MQKITFEDLPSTNTPLSANNLNTMQSNIETAINGKVVDSLTGSSTTEAPSVHAVNGGLSDLVKNVLTGDETNKAASVYAVNEALSGKFNISSNLTRAYDWNNPPKLNSIYSVNLWVGSGGSNYPTTQFTGFAIILTYYQVCFDMEHNKILSRRYSGNTWTAWTTW